MPPFVKKLYSIGQRATNESDKVSKVWRWQEGGTKFEILQAEDFCEKVLQEYFRSKAFASFLHQLSVYNFKRTITPRNAFAHPYFRRGRPDLLHKIERKTGQKKTSSSDKRKNTSNGSNTNAESKKKRRVNRNDFSGNKTMKQNSATGDNNYFVPVTNKKNSSNARMERASSNSSSNSNADMVAVRSDINKLLKSVEYLTNEVQNLTENSKKYPLDVETSNIDNVRDNQNSNNSLVDLGISANAISSTTTSSVLDDQKNLGGGGIGGGGMNVSDSEGGDGGRDEDDNWSWLESMVFDVPAANSDTLLQGSRALNGASTSSNTNNNNNDYYYNRVVVNNSVLSNTISNNSSSGSSIISNNNNNNNSAVILNRAPSRAASTTSPREVNENFQQNPIEDAAFKEMFAQFCTTGSEQKFDHGLDLLKHLVKTVLREQREKAAALSMGKASEDVQLVRQMMQYRDVLSLQLALTVPDELYLTHGKALKEMCLVCLRHTKFNLWRAKDLLHQYIRFRVNFIGDLNEQVTMFSSSLLNILQKRYVMLMKNTLDGKPVIVFRYPTYTNDPLPNLLSRFRAFHFLFLACRRLLNVPDDVRECIVILDYEYFRKTSTSDIETLKKSPTYIRNKSYYISTLILLTRLIQTSAWPFVVTGKSFTVASDDGIWADVFDRVRATYISAGLPSNLVSSRAKSYVELTRQINLECLPRYMDGTGDTFDLYGLCNRWKEEGI